MRASWREVIEEPRAGDHVGLVHSSAERLAATVAAWAGESLRMGGGAILIGTFGHLDLIRRELARTGMDVEAAERDGRYLAVEADWLLARFMLDGAVEPAAFRRLAQEMVARVRTASAGRPVRAWGEMVSLLRLGGNATGARRLELAWDEIIESNGIALLCSYEARSEEARSPLARDVLGSHRSVIVEQAPGHEPLVLTAPPTHL